MKTFDWDEQKEKRNALKHGIPFVRAIEIFKGPFSYEKDTRKEYGEKRYNAIGLTQNFCINVTFTVRGDTLRIISARPASKKEKKVFAEWLRNKRKE